MAIERKIKKEKPKPIEFEGKVIELEKDRVKLKFNGYHFLIYPQGNDVVLMKIGVSLADTLEIKPMAGNVILIR